MYWVRVGLPAIAAFASSWSRIRTDGSPLSAAAFNSFWVGRRSSLSLTRTTLDVPSGCASSSCVLSTIRRP